MMFNFEVEIRVQKMDYGAERELFCHDFGGNQSVKARKILLHSQRRDGCSEAKYEGLG